MAVSVADRISPPQAIRHVTSPVLILRSVMFNAAFYLTLVIYLAAAIPTFVLPRSAIIAVAKSWARTNLRLLRWICGIGVEWRGLDNIPPGPLLVASKHQSVWETFALLPLFADPTFIVKRELMWLPFFGWYMWKGAMVPVDRGARSQALVRMSARAAIEVRRGRQLIIFPEGTRRPPGAQPAYKFGVAHLYAETGVPCLPIALNSGVVWGRRSFVRRPGTVCVEILKPIEPGLDKPVFFERLQQEIEGASAKLLGSCP